MRIKFLKEEQERGHVLTPPLNVCVHGSSQKKNFVQGVHKKMSHSFCLISLATHMLESWYKIHWEGGIHSFVWSTTFLYDIREPRYEQINMGYQISHFKDTY